MMLGSNADEMNYWIGELGGLFQYTLSMPIKYDAEDRKTLEIAKDKIIEVNDPLKEKGSISSSS